MVRRRDDVGADDLDIGVETQQALDQLLADKP